MSAGWLLALPLSVSIPQIEHPVTDLADAIEAPRQEAIAKKLVQHREATGVQMAVLVVDSTGELEISDYAQEVFDQWGGGSAARDDGVLFVLAIADRRSRLHLGYGLEPVISDGEAQGMLDALRPTLRDGAYGAATEKIVHQVVARTHHLTPGSEIARPWGSVGSHALLTTLLSLVLGFLTGRRMRKVVLAADDKAPALRPLLRDRVFQGRVIASVVSIVGVAALAWDATGFASSYAILATYGVAAGWVCGGTPRVFGWVVAAFIVLTVLFGHGAWVDDAPYPTGGAMLWSVFGSLLPGTVVGLLMARWIYRGWDNPSIGGSHSSSRVSSSRAWSSSSNSLSSSRSSYSPSSLSSSSFSSSSSRSSFSSSRSSSSSYSGGGGRSGGGGASSSW